MGIKCRFFECGLVQRPFVEVPVIFARQNEVGEVASGKISRVRVEGVAPTGGRRRSGTPVVDLVCEISLAGMEGTFAEIDEVGRHLAVIITETVKGFAGLGEHVWDAVAVGCKVVLQGFQVVIPF